MPGLLPIIAVRGAGDTARPGDGGLLGRLCAELGYRPAASVARPGGPVPPASLWLSRVPDRPGHPTVDAAAGDLLRLVQEVRVRTGAPRVHLVADRRGGPVCRRMVQRAVPDRYGPGSGVSARDLVDRLVTCDTPRGWSGSAGPGEGLPADRVLCLGDADDDPDPAVGAVGDGAVGDAVDSAVVPRGSDGPRDLLDSEAGWQNLVRFLFGDVRVTADLVSARFPCAGGLTWRVETRTSVRGLPVVLDERTAAHSRAVPAGAGTADPADSPVHLATAHLWTRAAGRRTRLRCVVQVRLLSQRRGDGAPPEEDHLEGVADVDDHLVVDVEQLPGDQLVAWATWGSDIAVPLRAHQSTGEPLPDLGKGSGTFQAEVRLPRSGAFLGHRAAVALSVRPTAPVDPAG